VDRAVGMVVGGLLFWGGSVGCLVIVRGWGDLRVLCWGVGLGGLCGCGGGGCLRVCFG